MATQVSLNSGAVSSAGSLKLQTNGTTDAVTIDTAQNLGLGVTPSAWASNFRSLELAGGALWSDNSVSGANINLFKNAYADTNSYTYKYKTSNVAFGYTQDAGGHKWLRSTDATPTAGNAITFTQAMTLDSAGQLLIGTTSALVSNTGRGNITLNGSSDAILAFGNGGSNSAYIYSASTNLEINAIGSRYMSFTTNGSERARIDSSGNLLVGTTTANGRISVERAGGAPVVSAKQTSSGDYVYSSNAFSNGGTYYHFNFLAAGSGVGGISSSSTTTTYGTSSDYRLKENVAPMTGALTSVDALKPCTYTWKATGEAGQGFIAHELQAVVPDAVVGEKDAVDADGNPVYQSIDTSFLVATLTAAIQELNAKVEAQAVEIAALKG